MNIKDKLRNQSRIKKTTETQQLNTKCDTSHQMCRLELQGISAYMLDLKVFKIQVESKNIHMNGIM